MRVESVHDKIKRSLAAKFFLYKMKSMKAKKTPKPKAKTPAKKPVKKKPAKKLDLPKGWSEAMY